MYMYDRSIFGASLYCMLKTDNVMINELKHFPTSHDTIIVQ